MPVDSDVGYIVACASAFFVDGTDPDRGCTSEWSRTPAVGTATRALQLDGFLPASSEYWVFVLVCADATDCGAFTGTAYTSDAGASTYSKVQLIAGTPGPYVDTGVAIPTYTSPGGGVGFQATPDDLVAEMTGGYTFTPTSVSTAATSITVSVPVDKDTGNVCVEVGPGYNTGGGFSGTTYGNCAAAVVPGSAETIDVLVDVTGILEGIYSATVAVMPLVVNGNIDSSWTYASDKNTGMFRVVKYPGSETGVESEIGVTIDTLLVTP